MPSTLGPCRHCGRTVPRAATVCHACGYDADPDRNRAGRAVCLAASVLLALAPATAPASLATLWKAAVHHRALDGLVPSGADCEDGVATSADGLDPVTIEPK